jgi:hypothetical protein
MQMSSLIPPTPPLRSSRRFLRWLGKGVASFGKTVEYYINALGFHIYFLGDSEGKAAMLADVKRYAESLVSNLTEALRGVSGVPEPKAKAKEFVQ